jgi:prepilin-type processing-associated H-X9-DG protein
MPIQFSCPHCGKQTTVADQYAGQSGPCAGCNKIVKVPFSAPVSSAAPAKGPGAVLLLLGVFLIGGLLVCGGVVVAVALPVASSARTSAQRMNSSNNLKQLGLAIHNYHDRYNDLPPAIVKDAEGKPLYSGMVLLLPFIGQQNIFQQFDKSKAWDDPANIDLSRQTIVTLMNPASTDTRSGHCDYMLIGGPNAVLSDAGKNNFGQVRDGLSSTMVALEVGSGNTLESWAQPVAWDVTKPFDSPDPTMVNVLFGDGSVRALPKTTPVQTLRLISDRRDGQPVDLP